MAAITSFRDIIAWQKAHAIVLSIYTLTKKFPVDERFRLVDQMCRAAASVPANIAEGFARQGHQDTLRFYNIAQASLEELKYHMLLAKDLGYISQLEYEQMFISLEECSKCLYGWIQIKKW